MTKEIVKTEKATVYEVGFHIVPAVSPETLSTEVDAIKAVLDKNGATIISEEFPKLRNLAYMITKVIGPIRNKYDTAYFGWIKYEASSETAEEIKKAFDLNDKILRYLIIKTARENTLYGAKILPEEKKEEVRESIKEENKEEVKEVSGTSPEELDKSIDKLIV